MNTKKKIFYKKIDNHGLARHLTGFGGLRLSWRKKIRHHRRPSPSRPAKQWAFEARDKYRPVSPFRQRLIITITDKCNNSAT